MEEIATLRLTVRMAIEQVVERSRESGKPPMIILGEMHYSPTSSVINSIVLAEARRAGIRDLAIEIDQRNLATIDNTPFSRSLPFGTGLLIDQAEYFGMATHPVDDLANTIMEEVRAGRPADIRIDERNENMARNLNAIARPVMLLTGALHVDGLQTEGLLETSHEVVYFNTPLNWVEVDIGEGVVPLTIQGSLGNMDARQLIRLGLGDDVAAGFIARYEALGEILTRPEAEYQRALAQTNLRQNPTDLRARFDYMNTLYDIGQDAQAGRELAQVVPHLERRRATNLDETMMQSLMMTFHDARSYEFIEAGREEYMRLHPASAPPGNENERPLRRPGRLVN